MQWLGEFIYGAVMAILLGAGSFALIRFALDAMAQAPLY